MEHFALLPTRQIELNFCILQLLVYTEINVLFLNTYILTTQLNEEEKKHTKRQQRLCFLASLSQYLNCFHHLTQSFDLIRNAI